MHLHIKAGSLKVTGAFTALLKHWKPTLLFAEDICMTADVNHNETGAETWLLLVPPSIKGGYLQQTDERSINYQTSKEA